LSKAVPPFGQIRLFQSFSFWNSFLEFSRKTGPLDGFSGSLVQNQPCFETSSGIIQILDRRFKAKPGGKNPVFRFINMIMNLAPGGAAAPEARRRPAINFLWQNPQI
jgi:hypothetical protein